ncbi:hypothetical protein CXL00_05770 [Stutzerimonas stutzeri]|uniref:Uncharacterized protein n=1 Tax=Stutzerimonas stutzeri TaxID=316 RepID=A0A2N8T1C1_STUST|nr:hypothetical protein CXL00_05770 [Stutzerimonas stutzeri]
MPGPATRRGRACAERLEKLAVETAPTGDVVVEDRVGAVLTAKKTPQSASWHSVKERLVSCLAQLLAEAVRPLDAWKSSRSRPLLD